MRRLALGLLLVLNLSGSALAQMCGGGNCVAPTPPTGANNDQIATTAYVNNLLSGGLSLATGKIYIGSAGGIATPQTVSGDCTLSTLGALTCTKTNGVAFAPVATSSSATDLTTGTLPAARLPNPSVSTLGGVQSLTCSSNQWLNTISTSGVPACAQPAFSNLSGTAGGAQIVGQYSSITGVGTLTVGTWNATPITAAYGGTGLTSLGTGVATFLQTPSSANLAAAVTNETGSGALVFATSPTLVTPALGTPASGVLTNATGLPIGTGVSGLGTGVATFLATPSSANLAAAVTNETGTGSLVFGTSPTISTLLNVSANAGTPSAAAVGGTIIRGIGVDGSPARIGIEAYGTGVATAFASNNMRRANGTAASPSAVQSGDLLFGYIGTGYGTSDFLNGGGAGMLGWASSTYTTTGGAELSFVVTANGSGTNGEAMRILNTGQVKFTGAANFSANGSVATAMSSLGPTGSHTTVQEWFTIQNASGVTRYIPAF